MATCVYDLRKSLFMYVALIQYPSRTSSRRAKQHCSDVVSTSGTDVEITRRTSFILKL